MVGFSGGWLLILDAKNPSRLVGGMGFLVVELDGFLFLFLLSYVDAVKL